MFYQSIWINRHVCLLGYKLNLNIIFMYNKTMKNIITAGFVGSIVAQSMDRTKALVISSIGLILLYFYVQYKKKL